MREWRWGMGVGLAVALVAVAAAAAPKGAGRSASLDRGAHLVTIGGCNDCHTPWKMGPNGPEPDLSRMLSGHPQELAVDTASTPRPSGPWIVSVTGTFTAWAGPWGTSFSANLTPDPETGMGRWTEQNFLEAMRSGRHMGRGRPILPPMPWPNYAKMSDEDLLAVFAYLRSIPPIRNKVPDPLPPVASAQGAAGGRTP